MTAIGTTPIAPAPTTTVRTLADLDRDITRAATGSTATRVVAYAFVVLIFLGIVGVVLAADSGLARVTAAALMSAVILGFTALSPLVAGRATGLQPEHVRSLPVSADHDRAAITRRALRQFWGYVLGSMLTTLAVATSGGSATAIALAALGGVLTALILDLAPRIVGLRFARLMRSQLGKVIAVVAGVATLAAVYVIYLLAAQGVVDTGNPVLRAVVRVLPSGWQTVAAESADDGHWWLSALALIGLVVVAVILRADWARQIDRAMYDNAVSTPGRGSEARRPVRADTSAVTLVMRTEARMLLADSQRLGLLIMPVALIAIGLALLFSGNDTYGLRWGSPFIVFLMSSTMTNGYGLDRWGFATMITSRRAAPLVIRARMTLFAVAATPVALAATVIARAVRETDPSTWPIAIAVLVGGVVAGMAATAVLPALAPYRVPPGSGMGSINSRGSMSGRSLGLLVVYIGVFALICTPGVVVGAVAAGAFAWLAVVVELGIGVPVVLVAYRQGVRLVSERGPEILATVTATT
ncbi:hypothetical protein ACXVUM_02245 [Williamsia sp. SKLECPSW1]